MDEAGYYQQAFQAYKQLFSQVVSFAHWVVCCCCFHFVWGNLKASSPLLCISLSGWDRVGVRGGGAWENAHSWEVAKWCMCNVKQFFSVVVFTALSIQTMPWTYSYWLLILFFSHPPAAVCLQDLRTWSYYSIILLLTNWCVREKRSTSTSSGSALTLLAQNCFSQTNVKCRIYWTGIYVS